jgi:hypothetical protein
MAAESQIYIERYRELPLDAPERMVRLQGHGMDSLEIVLEFDKATLGYRHVLDGAGAEYYPLIVELRSEFGAGKFSAKDVVERTGRSRATAFRHMSQLYRAGCVTKAESSYQLIPSLSLLHR